MAYNQLEKYTWIINTIRRYGEITRRELDECWMRSSFSNGKPLPRRTFYDYRDSIEELFGIKIAYNPHRCTYSLVNDHENGKEMRDWVLNSTAITNLLKDSLDVADSIFLEDVPSAGKSLDVIINSLKEGRMIRFDYHPYTLIAPKTDIRLEPYFLKIFRQRWYVTGKNRRDRSIKTYALDRMQNVTMTADEYVIPPGFNPRKYVRDSFGIVFDKGPAQTVVLRVNPKQAKYFRTLPLHHSQDESICDGYSLFSYRLKITNDFVAELLSYGPKIVVEAPKQLRQAIAQSLKESLKNYESEVPTD